MAERESSAPAVSELKEGLQNVQASLPSATIPPTQLSFDRRSEKTLDIITDRLNTLADQSDDRAEAIWNRARQQVIVVAAILVIGEIDVDADERAVPSISSRHVDWAWELVKWSTNNWLALFNSKISGSEEEAAMNAIKDVLSRVADYAPDGRLADKANYGNSTRSSDICAKGWMPASLIGRLLRGLRSDIRDRALQALVKNEEVERQDVERGDGQQSGRSAVAYRLSPTGG